MSKTNVAVLRGGPSEEHHISLDTGLGVLEALENSIFKTQDILISKQGVWFVDGYERAPQHALATTDVVFVALHGSYGEDGSVQRILERLHIPYTGSGSYASALAMNKFLAKEHLKELGISMPRHFRVSKSPSLDVSRLAHTIESLFKPAYVVKPIAGGSSIGIVIVKELGELTGVLTELFETYTELLVEERIVGTEATCGVIENFRNEKLYALPVVEIIPPQKSDFYDTKVKYDGSTEKICPARFSNKDKNKIEAITKSVHRELGLSQYSRSDFIVTDDDVYFLEVNTLPGLTEESTVPHSVYAVGSTYSELVHHLLTNALQ